MFYISFFIFICWCSSFHFAVVPSFVVVSSFVDFLHSHFICFLTSSLILPWTITEFLHPFYTFIPAQRRVIHDTFIFSHSDIFLPRALWFCVGVSYPQAFFTLCSFTDILTCVYQGFPGSRQFFLEVCRASYWSSKYRPSPSSKHRPSPSVCLIHSNSQTSYSEQFSFKFYHILAWITCGETFSW